MQAFNIFFTNAPPHKTGYLRSRIVLTYTDNGFVITNDAPYMESTEEKEDGFKNQWNKHLII